MKLTAYNLNSKKRNAIIKYWHFLFILLITFLDLLVTKLHVLRPIDRKMIQNKHNPVSALDVAQYVLAKTGQITTMKLQKLVYYSQAWSLVWDESPLYLNRIEAWANGPVIPDLYNTHKGLFLVSDDFRVGNSGKLDKDQGETVDAVINYYGTQSPQWLSDLTHRESPWRDARIGLSEGERGEREITLESMANYYGSLPPNNG